MLRKIFAGLLAFWALWVLVASFSEERMAETAAARYAATGWLASDKYRFGDLYGLSYLPGFAFDDRQAPPDAELQGDTAQVGPKPFNLYMLGDSYLLPGFVTGKEQFPGAANLYTGKIDAKTPPDWNLDTAQYNILILERTERLAHQFADTLAFQPTLWKPAPAPAPVVHAGTAAEKPLSPGALWLQATHIRFNPMLETNIAFRLFERHLFSPFRQAKAWLNYHLFGRLSNEVALSPDGRYLLLKETVDSTHPNSAFRAVSNAQADSMVAGMNAYAHRFRQMGFDTVIFTIIPNPVSILYPQMGNYNHLAERLMHHPGLTAPVVSVADTFRSLPYRVYQRNDTHWNRAGFEIWRQKANQILYQLQATKP